MVDEEKEEDYKKLDSILVTLTRIMQNILIEMKLFSNTTYHTLGLEEMSGGLTWKTKPEIPYFWTTNRLQMVKSINDKTEPVIVRVVGGTVEAPEFVAASSGLDHHIVNTTLVTGTTTFDIENDTTLLNKVANNICIEADQNVNLQFNSEVGIWDLKAGDTMEIFGHSINKILVSCPATFTNIKIWMDD